MPVSISYVIPHHNNINLLSQCLASIEQQTYQATYSEIIIVDDCSTDESMAWLKINYPTVIVEKNQRNLGFARSANRGLKKAQGEWIILINTDVRLAPRCIEAASDWFSEKEIGSIAFSLLDMRRPELYDSAGDLYTIAGYAQKRKERLSVRDNPLESGPVFSASGAAAAYRSSALRNVGYFDESFEAYYEDVDLGVRLRLAGYECIFEKDALAYHLSGGSYGDKAFAAKREFLNSKNSEKLFFKYYPEVFGIPHVIRHFIVMIFHILGKFFISKAWIHFVAGKWEAFSSIHKTKQSEFDINREINKEGLLRVLEPRWINAHFASWVRKSSLKLRNQDWVNMTRE